ncbi:solute carrier family 35 member F2-like isoform X2 [Chenopodium quinoa]|uniref:solute carrier family 35 member F2-like isoform X2 n=1 Tax=Chenopodium quinoa TaxID=63459 RepID=UPI000B7973FE|nr:solute carrier family 35 member F2-like isoform X2 [Chenopodium quinoa]
MEGRDRCCNWLKNHESLCNVLFTLFLGQIISFTLATTSFAASYLATRGVDVPVTQSFFTYFGLASIYGSIMLFRRKKLLVPWYYYALLAFVDVQGNLLFIKAFKYTSVTSVTLFDCWAIVWVMILTWLFLGTRYTVWQYIGAAICVVGLCFALLSDATIGGGGGSRPLFGDFLVIVATLFYALSNVGEEFCVKQKDIVEVISMLGVFGMLVSMCQIILFERQDLEAIEWSADIILVFAGFAVGTCLFYSLVPLIFKVNWLYYVSFAIVVVGLVIYCKTENKPEPIDTHVDGHLSIQYEVLGEESLQSRDGSIRA